MKNQIKAHSKNMAHKKSAAAAFATRQKTRATSFFMRHPILSVLGTLVVLFALIAIQSTLKKPKPQAAPSVPVREVSIFSIGQAPRVRAQAKIEKAGVIKIVAQTAGVVQDVPVEAGQEVGAGANLAYISTNYTGSSTLTVQRQIAQKQYSNAKDTYDEQKSVIDRQREVAEKSDTNADRLREISAQSIEESRSLLGVNTDILNVINSNISQLEATNSADVNRSSIQALKQSKTVYQSAANSIASSIRSLDYSTDSDGVQAELANLTKEITVKQLDLQAKALTLSRDLSQLQYTLASINESLAYPSAPCAGVIEKVHVKFGDVVAPGTVLFTISTNEKSALAVALVSQEVARQVSTLEPSRLTVGSQSVSVTPSYVSQEATDGSLYSVYFALPDGVISQVTEGGYVEVEMAVGHADSTSVVPFIPLDAVHQTQDGAFVYVAKNGKVVARLVKLGAVYGQYVEVISGIQPKDHIILDRGVIDGEKITQQVL